MPTWGEILKEFTRLQAERQGKPQQPDEPAPADIIRRKYAAELARLTGRAVIIYESAFLEARPLDPNAISVHLGDVHGFMEACSNIEERELDLILHSPGGQAEAAESIMSYLRTRFDHIRAIVPLAAMSAATMMALAADEIVMGAHSQLGPIDPQFTVQTPEGPRSAPGQAILDQFDQAKLECLDPKNLNAWIPILRFYGPGLLALCAHQREMAVSCVREWLAKYMFASDPDRAEKAKAAADWFADFKEFLSHGRRVSREDAKAQRLRITDLESDHAYQDAVLSVHHALQITLAGPVAKVIENHHGRAWMKITQVGVQLAVPTPPSPGPNPPQRQGGANAPGRPNRGGAHRGKR